MTSPDSLDNNFIYLCGRIAQLVHEKLTDDFRKHGLEITVEQFGVLSLLWYREGINQQTIAANLHKDKSTIVRNIQVMVKAGLLEKRTDLQDQRNQLIYLTPKGKKLQKDSVSLAGETYMLAISSIDQGNINILIKTLNQAIKNLTPQTS